MMLRHYGEPRESGNCINTIIAQQRITINSIVNNFLIERACNWNNDTFCVAEYVFLLFLSAQGGRRHALSCKSAICIFTFLINRWAEP